MVTSKYDKAKPDGEPYARRFVPALDGLPVVCLRTNDADRRFPEMWKNFAAGRCVERFLQSDSWWFERLECARYAHIPVGNVGDDFAPFPVRTRDSNRA